MKIYLASPWFKDNERVMYRQILDKMRSQGHEVYAPIEHEIGNAWGKSNEQWAREVFNADIQAIRDCDEVWVLNFGMYSDSGTAWECGFAYALGKPVELIDQSNNEVSLMVVNGARNKENFFNKSQT